jgi:hypothetical protein
LTETGHPPQARAWWSVAGCARRFVPGGGQRCWRTLAARSGCPNRSCNPADTTERDAGMLVRYPCPAPSHRWSSWLPVLAPRRPSGRRRCLGQAQPKLLAWTDGRCEPRVCVGGAGMAYAQGGRDGQALAMQTPTPPLAAPTRRKRPVVPRMPRLREGAHRHLQGRPQAHLAVSGGACSDHSAATGCWSASP